VSGAQAAALQMLLGPLMAAQGGSGEGNGAERTLRSLISGKKAHIFLMISWIVMRSSM